MTDIWTNLEDLLQEMWLEKVIENYVEEDQEFIETYREIKKREAIKIKEEILIFIIEQTIRNTGTNLDKIINHIMELQHFLFQISKKDIITLLWELQQEDKIVLLKLYN